MSEQTQTAPTGGLSEGGSTGCTEYLELSRRGFLGVAGATASAAMLAATTAPAWLPRVSFARDFNTPPQDVIVCVFLRGGADGLNMVIPFNDPGYLAARNTLRVFEPDRVGVPIGHRAIGLGAGARFGNVDIGLHPALAGLYPAYKDGKLLIAACSGITGANKSHFDCQRYMERGKWNDPALTSGWIGRHMAQSAPLAPNSLLRGVAVASAVQQSMIGAPGTLPLPNMASSPGTADATGLFPMNNLRNYGLSGSSTTRDNRRRAINRIAGDPSGTPVGMYESSPSVMATAAQNTVNVINRLNQIGASSYRPAGGAVYPTNSFGYAMLSTAALIAANDLTSSGQAVDAVAIDLGGWDTHTDECRRDTATGTILGAMVSPMNQLAQGLGAFYADIIASRRLNVTVVVMSEFGRRVGENGGAAGSPPGTDHGYGNNVWIMGKNVLGGRVLAKTAASGQNPAWPGVPLATGNTQAYNLDMPITLDYRHLLAEIIDKRLTNPGALASVFPGFTPVYQGIVS